MTLSPNEAAGVLRDMAAVETRSRRVYGYRESSPHLILWGALWWAGYGLSEPWPHRALVIWITIVAIGLSRRRCDPVEQRPPAGRASRLRCRSDATAGIYATALEVPVPGDNADRLRGHRRHARGHGAGHQPPSRRVHPARGRGQLCGGRALAGLALHRRRSGHRRVDAGRLLSAASRRFRSVDGGGRRRRADPGRVLVPPCLKWNSPTPSSTSRCASRLWPR